MRIEGKIKNVLMDEGMEYQHFENDYEIWVNGEKLDPAISLAIVNHSPDGFMWGYGGSAPAQAALAILLHVKRKEFALANYQRFKWDVIAKQPMGKDFSIEVDNQTLQIIKGS